MYQQTRSTPETGSETAPETAGSSFEPDSQALYGNAFLATGVSSTPPEDTTGPVKANTFSTLSQQLFPSIDTDSDGYLSAVEVDAAVIDDSYKGEEAAVIATLNQLSGELEELSDDEWGDENNGVTLADLQAYERTGTAPDGLRKRVTRDFRSNEDTIAAQDMSLWGPTGMPLIEAVNQGGVGDCFFLAAVGALVERDPGQIKSLIAPSPDGMSFTVSFPKQAPQVIARPTDAELAQFAHGDGYGFWVNVLEKAYGHIQSPDSLVPSEGADPMLGGTVEFGIEFLTGEDADLDSVALSDRETMALKLTSAFDEGRIVCAGIGTPLPWEGGEGVGLPTGHAYSVIAWDPSTEVLTLRNPWGYAERNDDVDITEDGIFDISLDLFLEHFSTISYEGGAGRAPAPAPVAPSPVEPELKHTVAEGETLSGIADRYYGVMRLFEDLATDNYPTVTDANRIAPGMELAIPRYSTPVVTITTGTTLSGLALYWYGDWERASDIFEANLSVLSDPEVLPLGENLEIPMKGEVPPLDG